MRCDRLRCSAPAGAASVFRHDLMAGAVWLPVAWSALALSGVAAGGGEETNAQPSLGFATMNRDVAFPDAGTLPLPYPERNAVFPCDDVSEKGFHILCFDAGGNPRFAFLPLRDEWGHATAKAWTHDPSLAENTLLVQTPATLTPGQLTLRRGGTYSITAMDRDSFTVSVSLGGREFSRKISRSEATYEPPPPPPEEEKDPGKLFETRLQETLEKNQARQEEMRQRLDKTRESNEGIRRLLEALSRSDADTRRITAEIAREEKVKEKLVAFKPENPDVREQQEDKLQTTLQQQGALSAAATAARIETAALRKLRTDILESEVEVERLKIETRRNRAELETLATQAKDKSLDREKEEAEKVLAQKTRDLAYNVGEVEKSEGVKDVLEKLVGELEKAQKENDAVWNKLQEMVKEIEVLREKLRKFERPPE